MSDHDQATADNRVILKPCPFCGGDGLLHRVSGLGALWRVSCVNCDASPHGQFSEADAIAAWNKRGDTWQSSAEYWREKALLPGDIEQPAEAPTPVAWRWRYVRNGIPSHWTVRQSPIQAYTGDGVFCSVEVEPLYAKGRDQ